MARLCESVRALAAEIADSGRRLKALSKNVKRLRKLKGK